MRVLKAISSSPEVPEKISASKTYTEIMGAYERALNFQVSDGTMIGIVEREAGNCPGSIVISSFLGLTSQIDVGTRVSFYPSLLRIGGILAISLQEMSLWNPTIELQGNLCEPSVIRDKILNLLGIKMDFPSRRKRLSRIMGNGISPRVLPSGEIYGGGTLSSTSPACARD